MNANAKRLVKDILTASVPAGIVTALFASSGSFDAFGLIGTFFGFMLLVGGIPAGWRWANRFVTALTPKGLLIKLFFSLVLGWIAFPVAIVKDIVALARRSAPQT